MVFSTNENNQSEKITGKTRGKYAAYYHHASHKSDKPTGRINTPQPQTVKTIA